MTHSYAQPREKSNTSPIFTNKNVTCGKSNKSKDTIFEIKKSKFFHSMIAEEKKEILKKLCLILK